MPRAFAAALLLAVLVAGVSGCAAPAPPAMNMNQIAERYVKLVLAVGQHDENFVDAYYGDPAWKPTGAPASLESLAKEAAALRDAIRAVVVQSEDDAMAQLRHAYLGKQMAAVEARVAMLMGVKMSFDDEAVRLYDAAPPKKAEADFQPALDELNRLLPGSGSLDRSVHRVPGEVRHPDDQTGRRLSRGH